MAKRKDAGQAEVQKKFDEAEAQGYFGEGTPGKDNASFTVAGVTGGTDTNDDDKAAANTDGGAAETGGAS